jgi:hypothetical protein
MFVKSKETGTIGGGGGVLFCAWGTSWEVPVVELEGKVDTSPTYL